MPWRITYIAIYTSCILLYLDKSREFLAQTYGTQQETAINVALALAIVAIVVINSIRSGRINSAKGLVDLFAAPILVMLAQSVFFFFSHADILWPKLK